MLLRFLALFLPLRRVVWLRSYDGKVVLRRIWRHLCPDGVEIFMATTSGFILGRHQVKVMAFYPDGTTGPGWYYTDWGEHRPWWNPFPPEEDSRLIEINVRAKRVIDGRFRKTRTLPEVWEQG